MRLREAPPDDRAYRWLSAWYQICRSLPSARQCEVECSLVIGEAICEPNDSTVFGYYDEDKDLIWVARLHNPYEMLGTLLHEMAHAMTNPRHRRHHGYSWRRAFAQLTSELVGADPLPVAHESRRRLGLWAAPRRVALDIAVITLLTEQRVCLLSDSPPVAMAGGRTLRVTRE